ncbi:hypothetical protein PCANC_07385 [Puccinia coronata f. sp. avenae]|uniref:Hydrophobin n=1 Tax=Puccinia coronata f. sp. avenae TaxID=200324 RepID=A0A2N5T5G9_9BASI|nr:hypothetical protein PCANC_07385 [Puccinia coronata f. sp. avenae]PLW37974.1 hypothetical protein PCASD_10029 [Puccinia coronata f. sp. avenae]
MNSIILFKALLALAMVLEVQSYACPPNKKFGVCAKKNGDKKFSNPLNATGTQGSFDCKDPDAKTKLCCPKNAEEFKKKNKDLGALCREIETTVN